MPNYNMQTTITNDYIHLVAEAGNVLQNGETISQSVYLPKSAIIDDWQEIPYTPKTYLSRDKIVEWLQTRNMLTTVIQSLAQDPQATVWFFADCSYVDGSEMHLYLQNLLQLTDEDMIDLIEECQL